MLRFADEQCKSKPADPLEILAARVAVLEQRADQADRDLTGVWALTMQAKRLAGRLIERVAGFSLAGQN